MSDVRVVLLCGTSLSSRIVYNAVTDKVNLLGVIMEQPPSKWKMLARRRRKYGLITVVDQLLFMMVNQFIKRLSVRRSRQLIEQHSLNTDVIVDEHLHQVDNANSSECISLLQRLQPDIVIVNGTRILSEEVIRCIPAPFVNTHMGITPKYRGVHGGYWALVNKDAEHCGVTVHLVDTGIDTGGVLYQASFSTEASDNFNTYPLHQIAIALPLLLNAIGDVKSGELQPQQVDLPSRLYSHPRLSDYVRCGWRLGVW